MSPLLRDALGAFQRNRLDDAKALASQALAHREEAALAEHLLGLVACRQGDLASGVDHLRRAAAARPDDPAFRTMLVRALIDAGKTTEALEAAPPPQVGASAALPLWHARGEAADAAGDHGAAAEAWSRLAEARPDDWRAWSNAGNALAVLGRWNEAADALLRASQLNPSELPIRGNLAAALVEAQRHDAAAEILRDLVARNPDDARLRLVYAEVLTELGRAEAALAQLDAAARLAAEGGGLLALATKPGATDPDAKSVRKIGRLLERTGRMDALESLLVEAERSGIARSEVAIPAAALALKDGDAAEAKRLLLADIDTDEPGPWHRLMSKAEDQLGNVQAAFDAAAKMNRAVSDFDNWRERGAAYRARVRGLGRIATRQWAAALPLVPPSPRRAPAFLVGFPRSGTTLLDTFLMGHPDAAVLEEVPLLGAAERVLGELADLPQRSGADLAAARAAYFAELDRHIDPTFTGLVVDKLPLNMIGLPFIHALFPGAPVIFAQRHPADAVLSGFMQNFVLNDAMACFLEIVDAADLYDAAMSTFTRQRDVLPMRVHTLIYEELVMDPAATLRPLVSFLELPWRDALLDHQRTARERGAILTPSYDQVVKPLSSTPKGRWRRYADQLAPVLPTLLHWARQLGYADDAQAA